MERNNLWAPWRIGYITAPHKKTEGCFLCHHQEQDSQDDDNLVLWRSQWCVAVLNRYPYNNGHVLIAPKRHFSDLSEATDAEMLDLMHQVRDSQACLKEAVNPDGFNVGINTGRCAGAGLPGHLHIHVVPRWNGDTNFMSVCSDTEVISQSMNELMSLLRQAHQS
ncbi:MAG: HIT domain-containing protein [Phycisphaerae bacterium]|nr:HIT domain-containing protein [Phycisphaerae bacterium]